MKISHSETRVAEAIRRRVIAEGGYMFHERRPDGSWLHGFERRGSDGNLTRLFSPALMTDIRRNKRALHMLGEWMCRDDSTPRGMGPSCASRGRDPQPKRCARARLQRQNEVVNFIERIKKTEREVVR